MWPHVTSQALLCRGRGCLLRPGHQLLSLSPVPAHHRGYRVNKQTKNIQVVNNVVNNVVNSSSSPAVSDGACCSGVTSCLYLIQCFLIFSFFTFILFSHLLDINCLPWMHLMLAEVKPPNTCCLSLLLSLSLSSLYVSCYPFLHSLCPLWWKILTFTCFLLNLYHL